MNSSKVSGSVASVTCLLLAMTAFAVAALGQDDPPPADPPAGDEVPAAERAVRGDSTAAIFMPDGQLTSNALRVYVTRNIRLDQSPRLELLHGHAVTRPGTGKAVGLEPRVVATGQEWVESVEGQQVQRAGTLLMFDVNTIEFGVKAMQRVVPVLRWTEDGAERVTIGSDAVNVANIVNTMLWTGLVVLAGLALILLLAWKAANHPLELLTGAHGRLSLAQAQIACWTVAVGAVVLGYGFVRLQIPEIPMSLLALMGASLSTGGIAFFKDAQKTKAAARAGLAPATRPPLAIGDLIRTVTPGEPADLSLAKAQMLFWTVLLLVLFVSKSILEGAIWAVPWPLVALMGFSQAGYLVPKVAPQS